jgi:hypothetical protein
MIEMGKTKLTMISFSLSYVLYLFFFSFIKRNSDSNIAPTITAPAPAPAPAPAISTNTSNLYPPLLTGSVLCPPFHQHHTSRYHTQTSHDPSSHFVPNITFGPPLLEWVKKGNPDIFMDCHMMVADPMRVSSRVFRLGVGGVGGR